MTTTMRHDTALHEAAHAVVASALGVGVRSLEVHDDGGGMMRTVAGELAPEVAAAIAAAGLEAGRIVLHRADADGGYVTELDHAGADLERLRREVPGDDDDARARRGAAMDDAHRILVRRWSAVERLADLLHERRTLDAEEIAAFLGVTAPAPERATARPAARQTTRQRRPMTCIREHIGIDGRRVLEGGYIVADHREVLANPDCYGPWPGQQ